MMPVRFVSYVKRHYSSNSVVIFDGYDESAMNTKNVERQRRSLRRKSPHIFFDASMTISNVNQENFLSNDRNKSRLIAHLSEKMRKHGQLVHQAPCDADIHIINTAIQISASQTVLQL